MELKGDPATSRSFTDSAMQNRVCSYSPIGSPSSRSGPISCTLASFAVLDYTRAGEQVHLVLPVGCFPFMVGSAQSFRSYGQTQPGPPAVIELVDIQVPFRGAVKHHLVIWQPGRE